MLALYATICRFHDLLKTPLILAQWNRFFVTIQFLNSRQDATFGEGEKHFVNGVQSHLNFL